MYQGAFLKKKNVLQHIIEKKKSTEIKKKWLVRLQVSIGSLNLCKLQ